MSALTAIPLAHHIIPDAVRIRSPMKLSGHPADAPLLAGGLPVPRQTHRFTARICGAGYAALKSQRNYARGMTGRISADGWLASWKMR